MHPLHFFICLFDCLPNEFLIFEEKNLDLTHLMKIQCVKDKEKKLAKKKMLLTFLPLFSPLSYVYSDLENWLAGWLPAYLDVFLKIKSIN